MEGARPAWPLRWQRRRSAATDEATGRDGAARAQRASVAARLRTLGVADGPLSIRPVDAALTAAAIVAIELNVAVGGGYGAVPLNAKAYLLGAVLAVPILLRRRWPLPVLLACSVLLMFYYAADRRNISPAPLLCLPLYDTAVAGYLAWAIAIPAIIMAAGLVAVGAGAHESPVTLAGNFLPSIVILMLAVMLGEVVRGRRALAAETATRLRLADEEREAEAARRVAEERLRIARELHDVVAHTMATINVQAGVAAHVLHDRSDTAAEALQAIRTASKEGLRELRAILNVLRQVDEADPTQPTPGLAQLGALVDETRRAGLPITLAVTGPPGPLPAAVDLAGYRIIQESLTNVLKHAGPVATTVSLDYGADELRIEVTDAGPAVHPAAGQATDGRQDHAAGDSDGPGAGHGHGLTGMRERAASVRGAVHAGPSPAGGYRVVARLPIGGRRPAAEPLPSEGQPPATTGEAPPPAPAGTGTLP